MLVDLFKHFDTYTILPISPDVVAEQLVGQGCQDIITFHLVETKADILRGLLRRYTVRLKPYGDPEYHSDIGIAVVLPDEWRRVVATKELLHIVDTDEFTAQSRTAVDTLLSNFSFPQEIQENTNSYVNDRTHLILALGVLVPLECRRILRELIAGGKLTPESAARIAQIPARFIEPILSPQFEIALTAVTAVNQSGHHVGR